MEKKIEKLAHYSVGAYKSRKTRRGVAYEGALSYDGTPIGCFHNDGDGGADDITIYGFHKKAFADLAEEIFAGYRMTEKTSLLLSVLIFAYENKCESGFSAKRISVLQNMIDTYLEEYSEFKNAA